MQNKLLTILCALSIIFLLLWNRFRTRLPRDFIDTVPNQRLIVIIIITLKSLLILKHNSLFSKLLTNSYVLSWLRIKDFIINAPYRLYEIIFNTINLRHFIVRSATPLKVYYNYPKITYIIFFILPRVIVSTIFIIDLCYNHQFTYFYNSLILLVIPLITYCYLYTVGHLTHVNIIFIDKHLDIVRSQGEVTVSVKNVQPTFEGAMDITDIDLDNLMNHRLIFRTLRDYASEILVLKKNKEPVDLSQNTLETEINDDILDNQQCKTTNEQID